MSTCIYCGAENSDGVQICAACGNPLPQLVTTSKKKKNSRRKRTSVFSRLLIGLVIVGILASAAIWLLHHFSSKNRLDRAFDATFQTLEDQLGLPKSIHSLLNVLDRTADSEKVSFYLESVGGSDKQFTLSLDFNHRKRTMRGLLQFGHTGEKTRLLFAMKKDVFQFGLPDITPDVYGFSMEDLRESLVVQSLQPILGISLSSAIPTNLDGVLDDYLSSGRSIWEEFWESVKVEPLDDREDCDVYRLSWSFKDIAELHSKESGSVLREEFYRILNLIDGSCTCYVNDTGKLAKLEAVIGNDLYTVLWSGNDNPWDKFSVESKMNAKTIAEGRISVNSNEFQAAFSVDGKGTIIDLNYREDTNAFSIKAGPLDIKGSLSGTEDSVRLQFAGDDGAKTMIELSELTESPELLSSKYIDLLDLDLGEISELAIRLAANSEKIKSVWALFSELISSIRP